MSVHFDRLRAAARSRNSLLCVGLDPEPDRISGGASGASRFCREVVAMTAELACCYKPNAAFWEQYGADGWRALAEVRAAIPEDIPVLFDGKRGDVGNTMAVYARSIFLSLGMDAATISPYLGRDSVREFARYEDRGTYLLCRTSNPGAADLQDLEAGGRPVFQQVVQLAESQNQAGNLGLVVGATSAESIAAVRARSRLPFLIPGVGHQGGDLEASVRAGLIPGDEASCLVAVSRSVLYADDPALAAQELVVRMRVVAGA